MKRSDIFTAAAMVAIGAAVIALATQASSKRGFIGNIEQLSRDNSAFRRVLYTGRHMQLVLMTLQPGEEIGMETHGSTDQFFRFESGTGEMTIGGIRSQVRAGTAALVPAGTEHNVKNTGSQPLTLYTLYAPPQHADGTLQATKAAAETSKERFDGKTTE